MPKLETKFFWTDRVQAGERLAGTFVLLGDEPIYIRAILDPERSDDMCPVADYMSIGSTNRQRVRLDDARFGRFRKLPVLGWVNHEESRAGVLLERKPVRNRQHGLSETNTMVGALNDPSSGYDQYQIRYKERPSFANVASDPGYAAACRNEYPPFADVITHIRPITTIAISPLFAIHRDELGIRWLYRLNHRVAIISGADSLLLLDKYKFMREELLEDDAVTVQNIREF